MRFAFATVRALPLIASAALASAQTVFINELEVIPIYTIQGASHTSPFAGLVVSTTGIVTAVDSNGFYLQDAVGDGDDATSDAIFVFTSSAPNVAVGDSIDISGTVSEFTPGGTGTGNLSSTQLSGTLTIEILSSGNTLPVPVIIGSSGRVPPSENIDDDAFGTFDPVNDGIDFFESLEAMLVTAEDVVAVGGTNRFGEIFAVINQGAGATGLSARGTLNISPDDFNPEKVQIDEDMEILPGFTIPEVNTGALLGDVTGVVGYGFGNFEIYPTETFTVEQASVLTPDTTSLTSADEELTVVSYNVLNLDPSDIAGGQFDALARHIVSSLFSPDILGLQEIQDNSGSVDDRVTAADVTLQTLVNSIAAAGGPDYKFIDNPFIGNNVSGGQPGANIRTAFLYNPDRVDLVDGSVTTIGDQDPGSTFNGARLPLVAEFEFNCQYLTIVNNHFSSKGGSAPILGVEQDFAARQEDPSVNGSLNERREQAQEVHDFVADLLEADASANVIVLGDLNEFEFVSPLRILAGLEVSINGGFDTDPGEAAILTNLVDFIPEDERYSFIFQGNSQQLDHILVSDNLVANGFEIDVVHVNSELAESNPARGSDHDPVVTRFQMAVACDACPNDPDEMEPGICGCGVADTDTDGDLVPDCIDEFPNDPAESADSDTDGVGDNADICADTEEGDVVNKDGCSIDQLVPCEGPWGQYLRELVRNAFRFWRAGLINRNEFYAIIRDGILSDCGKT